MNFLKSYCQLLENTEIPARFQIWTGISCILAMLERRVWIEQGIFNVYPNHFIVLIAAAGQRKSTVISHAGKLIKATESAPNIVAQKVTPEALISAIKLQKGIVKNGKQTSDRCGGLVVADELTTFLDQSSLQHGLGPILTQLFDCEEFKYETVSRGVEIIKGGYLSILGGTTVELLRNALPKDAVAGGFTSRTIFVYEDKLAPPVAWVEVGEQQLELRLQLIEYLQSLTELQGPVRFTPEAKEFFKREYDGRYYNSEFRLNPMLMGYENRRAMHLLKVSLALLLSEQRELLIQEQHLQGAKVILEDMEQHLPLVMDLLASSDVGAQSNMVFQFIRGRGKVGISRADLVRQFSNRMDTQEISKILSTLVEADKIKAFTQVDSSRLHYKALV